MTQHRAMFSPYLVSLTLARKNWPPNYIILMRFGFEVFIYSKSVQHCRPAGGADLYWALVLLRILCML